MSNDFEGKWHKGLEILKKLPSLRDDPRWTQNKDLGFQWVSYTNLSKYVCEITQDPRFSDYCVQWGRPVVKGKCVLKPGMTATFFHDYLIVTWVGFKQGDAPEKALEKRWGRDRVQGGRK